MNASLLLAQLLRQINSKSKGMAEDILLRVPTTTLLINASEREREQDSHIVDDESLKSGS